MPSRRSPACQPTLHPSVPFCLQTINVDVNHEIFEVQEEFAIGLGEVMRARAAEKVCGANWVGHACAHRVVGQAGRLRGRRGAGCVLLHRQGCDGTCARDGALWRGGLPRALWHSATPSSLFLPPVPLPFPL